MEENNQIIEKADEKETDNTAESDVQAENEVTSEVKEEAASKETDKEEADTTEYTQEEFEGLLKKQRRLGTLFGVLYSVIFVSIILITVLIIRSAAGKNNSSVQGDLINENVIYKSEQLWSMIDRSFLWEDRLDAKKVRDEMYKAILKSLDDPYSVYYTEEEFAELLESSSGEYSGIGAYVAQNADEAGATYISKPMPGSPAEEAGLATNDYIITIDGEDVTGQDLSLVVSKIKGPEGTTVKLGIRHENKGDIEEYTIERRTIEVAMLESEMLEDKIGYIWVYEFEGKTLTQFKAAYESLKNEGMEGLIIDLRDNPGGDLDVVCNMADIFLDEGVICYTKNKKGTGDVIKSDAACEELPIVIITNGNSASASEIFTGSLKDRGVAVVVGQNTFGKGIVQGLYSLPDGTGVKFTESEYYLPNDECIHGVGIAPDYEVELDYDAYKKDKTDAQKDKAIEVMKELLK